MKGEMDVKDKASKLKVKKMKELIDLYEQVENVKPKSSRLIVENHIGKLEEELVQILKGEDEK